MTKTEKFSKNLKSLYKSGYVSASDLEAKKSEYASLCSSSHFSLIEKLKINYYFKNRVSLNSKFLNKFKRRGNLEVEGFPLDPDQLISVSACEDASLFLAPAGSGKTSSLLGKILYLVRDQGYSADSILLIAFNRKIVSELRSRSPFPSLKIKTFHSLGNEIIKNSLGIQKSLISEKDISSFLRNTLKTLISDPVYREAYHDFILFYLNTPADLSLLPLESRININKLFRRKNLFELNCPLNNFEFSLRDKESELFANFSFLYGITPDFAALKSHSPEYPLFDWASGTPFESKKTELPFKNLSHIPEETVATLLNSDEKYRDDASSFFSLISTFLNLQKNAKLSLKDLKLKIKSEKNPFLRHRSELFYRLYEPIFVAYKSYLEENHLYDYADMINLAIDIIDSKKPNSLPYRYILVDEAQDLSKNRLLLLKSLLSKSKNAKLFAVGDDWQSINRFAGSDNSLINNFSSLLSRETYTGFIGHIYRFGDPQAKISTTFIKSNPSQSQKQTTPKPGKTTIKITLGKEKRDNNIPDDYELFESELLSLYKKYGSTLKTLSLQIISRYNSDIYRLVKKSQKSYKNLSIIDEKDGISVLEYKNKDFNLIIPFSSVHRAKGITRDIVFVLNINTGLHGFPSTRLDDPLLALLLSDKESFPFAEERRLFYVALTRSKKETILLANEATVSPFLFEISAMLDKNSSKICPKCHSGVLVTRENKKTHQKFISCTNWTNGCNYTKPCD